MTNRFALDTNVLIYLHDLSNLSKAQIAKDLLSENPVISSQVISEYINVTRRILDFSKNELLEQTAALFATCIVPATTPEIIYYAAGLIKKYNFQIFDAIIVAAAILAKCDVLYSEDMHHGLLVENQLTILNPFIGI